ncbi:hypothetical protein RFI_00763 [Reticulomyxa filosa]|uniref:Ras-related protein Rab-7b n=1 Tax=Reticulomyxa filosa TaxID=46433 RepID=X6PE13_RETFI|nr:hypothetical protein RFI_00763 [Reticulomyxa filosa]|eukprot:ETO36299.1 hypothetical protein RFI_00763 [Reticulomyxa filosa]
MEEKTREFVGNHRTLLKIVVLGDSGVGKTALLHQYVDGKFIQTHQATIGADLLTKTVEVDNITVSMQIWDTAGQERYDALGSAYYRGADGCIFVYDITNKSSFEHLNQWRQNFLSNAADEHAPVFKFLLLANKSDLANDGRKVTSEEGERYAQSSGMTFFETSAKNGNNVNQAFVALIRDIASAEEVALYSTEVAERIKMVEQEMDGKNQKPNMNCGC